MKDLTASPKVQSSVVQLGGIPCTVVTIALSGTHPTAKVEGARLVVGGQSLSIAEGGLLLERFTPEAADPR
jgi:hypothetical protein